MYDLLLGECVSLSEPIFPLRLGTTMPAHHGVGAVSFWRPHPDPYGPALLSHCHAEGEAHTVEKTGRMKRHLAAMQLSRAPLISLILTNKTRQKLYFATILDLAHQRTPLTTW